MVEEKLVVTLIQLKHNYAQRKAVSPESWPIYRAITGTHRVVRTVPVLGKPFCWLSSQINLVWLFNSKLTFLKVGCCGSVRWFRPSVTCTCCFAHTLFFKVETINSLVSKCFLYCTKTYLSGIFLSSEDFGFWSTWEKLFLFIINSLFPLLPP